MPITRTIGENGSREAGQGVRRKDGTVTYRVRYPDYLRGVEAMSDGAKCDFCNRAAVAVSGETNGLLLCPDHLDRR